MLDDRAYIPQETLTSVLIKSKRRCCLCYFLDDVHSEKEGQVAHIGSRSNPNEDNLVWLCMKHHSRFDSTTSQHKNYTSDEIKKYRDKLYRILNAEVKWEVILSGTVKELNEQKLNSILKQLQNLAENAELHLRALDNGSIKLILEGSFEDFIYIRGLFNNKQLSELAEYSIQKIDQYWHNILAFDGGGVCAIFQSSLLRELESYYPLIHEFNMFAGSGTGGIVATALATGRQPNEVTELLKTINTKIYCKSKSGLACLFTGATRHSSEKLHSILIEFFGEMRLGDCKQRVIIPTVMLHDSSVRSFDSMKQQDASVSIVDVLLATTAMPTLFSPHEISDLNTVFIDGTIACNNPSMEAIRISLNDGIMTPNIRMISLGTGIQPKVQMPSRLQNKSSIKWMTILINSFIHTNSNLVHSNCKTLLSEGNYLRIDPYIGINIGYDDAIPALEILPVVANQQAREIPHILKDWSL